MSEGYKFVPFPSDVQRRERRQARWDQLQKGAFAGLVRMTLRAEQAVHIGNGLKSMHEGKITRQAVRIHGRPGIPGSSLKGVLRSRYEAITRSCVRMLPQRRAAVKSRSHPNVKAAVLANSALDEAVFRGSCDDERSRAGGMPGMRSCPACALFGCTSLRSRITVHDFACPADVTFAVAPIRPQFGPRLHHVGEWEIVGGQLHDDPRTPRGSQYRDRQAMSASSARHRGEPYFDVRRLRGRKFAVGVGPTGYGEEQWIEVIPSESTIIGTLGLFNVLPDELGGLLAAIGRIPGGVTAVPLKIGGGKGRGFGRVRLVDIAYELRDHDGHHVPVSQEQEETWRKDFEESADYWDKGECRLREIHQGDC